MIFYVFFFFIGFRLVGRLFGLGEEGEDWWDYKCVFYFVVVRELLLFIWRMYYYGCDGDNWLFGVRLVLLLIGCVGFVFLEDGVYWSCYRGLLF